MRTANRIRKHPQWVRTVCAFVRGMETARYANRLHRPFIDRFNSYVDEKPMLSVYFLCALLVVVHEVICLMFS